MQEKTAGSDPEPVLHRFVVLSEHAGKRLDRYLAERLPDVSRTRVQDLIAEGLVRVQGARVKSAYRVAAGETIDVDQYRKFPVRIKWFRLSSS